MCIYIYLRVPIIRTVTLTGRATWMGGRGIGYRGNLPTPPRQRAPITKRILRARSDRTVPGRVRTNTERGERESEQGRGELGGSRLSELPRRGRPRPLFIPPVLAIVNSLSVCPSLPHFYPLHSSPLRSTSTRFVFYVIRISTVSFGSFFFYLSRFVFSLSSPLRFVHYIWLSFSRGFRTGRISVSLARQASLPVPRKGAHASPCTLFRHP